MSNIPENGAPRYGAYQNEWQRFVDMGLTADLLPVVSNPSGRISPLSSMKQIGKTPSVYNDSGRVVGIPKWTEKLATQEEIARWREMPDYGICIQTRNIRAIDIDVDDPAKAQAIVQFIQASMGRPLPMRYRTNSGKCLLAFRMEGYFPKRSMRVDGGIIEFLGNGQQFIAAGTHPSGVRYKWDWGNEPLPIIIPNIFEGF